MLSIKALSTVFANTHNSLIKLTCNLLRVFSCKIPKYSDAQVYDKIGLLFDVAFHIL